MKKISCWVDDGGVLIGVSEALAGLFIDPSAKSMFSFGLLIVVLLFRPQGLLGERRVRFPSSHEPREQAPREQAPGG